MKVIDLQYEARCADCGAELPVGTSARYYGRGRIYGLTCHGQNGDGPTVKEQAATELAEISSGLQRVAETGPVCDWIGCEVVATVETEHGLHCPEHAAETDRIEAENAAETEPDIPTEVKRIPARARARKPKVQKVEAPGVSILRAARAAARGISTRPGIPALTGIMVEAGADRLTFTSTDLEITTSTTAPTPGWMASGWRALVPGKLMADALKAVGKAERFTFGPDPDGASFTIGAATFRTLVAEDFPMVREVEGQSVTVEAERFAEAIRAVGPHASGDEARPVLTGVLVESGKDGVRFAATDSYTLAVADVAESGPELRALVPERALSDAARIIGKRAGGSVELTIGESQVRIGLPDGSVITSRIIEGEFPNYRQLVPEPGGNTFETGIEFEDAIRAAAPLARDSAPVRLELTPGMGARVTASSPDLGSYAEAVPGEYSGEALTVAFNPAYLLRTLAVAPGAPLEMRDGLKPSCVRAPGRIGLVMPVRLPAPVG